MLTWSIKFVISVEPDDVTLVSYTTENNGCNMWVNFTCKSSEANPPVHNYVLLRNETDVGLSEKGTWVEKISPRETFVYKCQAYQQVDNVTSTNNISLSVKDLGTLCLHANVIFLALSYLNIKKEQWISPFYVVPVVCRKCVRIDGSQILINFDLCVAILRGRNLTSER